MTLARALLIGVGIAAVVLLEVMVPAILKVMTAILWVFVIFISAQLTRAIAFVLPSGPFPARPADENTSSDEAEVPVIGERSTMRGDTTRRAGHVWAELVSEPPRAGEVPRSLSAAARRHTLSMVHSSIGCRRC